MNAAWKLNIKIGCVALISAMGGHIQGSYEHVGGQVVAALLYICAMLLGAYMLEQKRP